MFKPLFIIFLLTVCSGCATTSIFSPYPSQINPLLESVAENLNINLKKEFGRKLNSKDRALYLLEQGRIAQIKGDIFLSKKSFQLAEQAIKAQDEKAIISASGAATQASTILVNDNALPYRTRVYERAMLHQFQAMNYLYQNNIEGAAVEIRKANLVQEKALKDHLAEIENSKQYARQHNVPEKLPDTISNVYSRLDSLVGDLKSSFQNAYIFYFSAIIYELNNQINDAYIDYKKAFELFPSNQYIQRNLIRLAKQLNMREDLEYIKRKYPFIKDVDKQELNQGELVILFEDSFISPKQEVKLPIPISLDTLNLIAVAFPIYNAELLSSTPLQIYEHGSVLAESEPICNLSLLAIKSLKEEIPSLTIHQMVRAASKAVIAKQAEREFGDLGALAVSAYNVFSENADLRSWNSLPSTIHIAQLLLTEGEHELAFLHQESGANTYIKVNIKPNSKKIIRFVRTGNKLYYLNIN